jgi:hypothetical protein
LPVYTETVGYNKKSSDSDDEKSDGEDSWEDEQDSN